MLLSILLPLMAFPAITDGKRIPINMTDFKLPFVTLYVGTPPQTVTVEFDSGSPLFWTRGVDPKGECAIQYNPNASSTAEQGAGDVSFQYGTGGFSGPSLTDLAGFDSPPSMRSDVTSSTMQANMSGAGTSCYDGILGMDQASQFMTTYFENHGTGDAEKYFVADFNIGQINPDDDVESWFEIGDPEDGTGSYFDDPSECVALLPRSFEDRMTVAPVDGNPLANSTFWWQYNVTKFTMGDKESTGRANAIFDDGTASVLGNFASIFSPDPVPDDLCQYMYENNATFNVEYLSQDGGKAGVYSVGWDDVLLGDNKKGDPLCMIQNLPDLPETFITLGINFYNKYLIKHDYVGEGQVCATSKPGGYKTTWQSSSLPDFSKFESESASESKAHSPSTVLSFIAAAVAAAGVVAFDVVGAY